MIQRAYSCQDVASAICKYMLPLSHTVFQLSGGIK